MKHTKYPTKHKNGSSGQKPGNPTPNGLNFGYVGLDRIRKKPTKNQPNPTINLSDLSRFRLDRRPPKKGRCPPVERLPLALIAWSWLPTHKD